MDQPKVPHVSALVLPLNPLDRVDEAMLLAEGNEPFGGSHQEVGRDGLVQRFRRPVTRARQSDFLQLRIIPHYGSREHLTREGRSVADPRTVALRRKVGSLLRLARSEAGLSGHQLAQRMPFTQSKISRIETGDLWPKISEILQWLDVCGVSQRAKVRGEILALAETIETGVAPYRSVQRGSLETRARELLDIDANARLIRQYHPVLLTGPFHSAGYARACIEAANLDGLTDVDAAVSSRLDRGRRIRHDGIVAYEVILTEAALSWTPAAAPGSVRESLHLLLAGCASPTISVRILPTATPQHALTQCGFFIVDWKDDTIPPVVIVETPALEITTDVPHEVDQFNEVWGRLSHDALSPDESHDFVRDALSRYR